MKGCGVLLLAIVAVVQAVNAVTLEWDPSPDAWVAGYAIHYGSACSNYTARVDVGNETAATITNLAAGVTYYFVATAYTADGQESLPSNEVAYTVPLSEEGMFTNQPPIVEAGEDQIITLPAVVTLAATVSDDGLPADSDAVQVVWMIMSGPDEIEFENPTTHTTAAEFLIAGSYVLRVIATDGELTASDDLTVTVVEPVLDSPVGLMLEAENGWLSSPTLVGTNADGAVYVSTDTAGGGGGCYGFEVRQPKEYVIWARVLAAGELRDRLYLQADGGNTNILRASSSSSVVADWQWVCVVPESPVRVVSSPGPRRFKFDAGYHSVTIWGNGVGLRLDKFIVTDDLDFVPTDQASDTSVPVISNLSFTSEGCRVSWSARSGLIYRLVCRESLSDTEWRPASPNLVALGDELTWTDDVLPWGTSRFYAIHVIR